MMDPEIQAALQSFRSEAQELLEEMDERLLRLEDARGDAEELNGLFRTVHTIKGTAGLFGLHEMVGFTHQVETVMDHLRGGAIACSPPLTSLFFACKDHIETLLKCSADSGPLAPEHHACGAALQAQLKAFEPAVAGAPQAAAVPPPGPAEAPTACWRISAQFGADTFRDGFDPASTLAYLTSLGELLQLETRVDAPADFDAFDPESCFLSFDLSIRSGAGRAQIDNAFKFVQDSCQIEIVELPGAALATPAKPAAPAVTEPVAAQEPPPHGASAAPRAEEQHLVRVPADKLDELINLVGELVIASSGTGALARKHRIKELVSSTSRLNALTEEIRDRALGLRMVPIGETFVRFRRIVRDLSAKLGKQVELKIVGGDAELDKSMVERLNDPLVHLVRNALDHGIKTPEYRLARGKSAFGTLTLAARHQAGGIVISVEDDGAGFNRARILDKARERGVVAADAELSDEQIDQLIFAPGFSTAEAVTDVSGRGVGLDVVQRSVEAMRGTLSVTSVPGKGSRFEIRMPLTLAIIEGFHVRVGNHPFVLPMDSVVECINNRQLAPPVPGRCTGHLSLRGAVLPVLHLRGLFELDGPYGERQSIVVVRSGGQQVGLVMDMLLGEGQTVIKPMGELFAPLEGIAGSTVLGTGEVALILDVATLVDLAVRGDITHESG